MKGMKKSGKQTGKAPPTGGPKIGTGTGISGWKHSHGNVGPNSSTTKKRGGS